ncbi:MAG: hypothetical protein Unbinned7358contig1000_4 [Prokaryotic dsDNA virus sp.]|nr:MAG: hypothetical protein Unbinned7358contig1000_4 [Prokaryotic dsDNA virus sp.]
MPPMSEKNTLYTLELGAEHQKTLLEATDKLNKKREFTTFGVRLDEANVLRAAAMRGLQVLADELEGEAEKGGEEEPEKESDARYAEVFARMEQLRTRIDALAQADVTARQTSGDLNPAVKLLGSDRVVKAPDLEPAVRAVYEIAGHRFWSADVPQEGVDGWTASPWDASSEADAYYQQRGWRKMQAVVTTQQPGDLADILTPVVFYWHGGGQHMGMPDLLRFDKWLTLEASRLKAAEVESAVEEGREISSVSVGPIPRMLFQRVGKWGICHGFVPDGVKSAEEL